MEWEGIAASFNRYLTRVYFARVHGCFVPLPIVQRQEKNDTVGITRNF